jgi:hypothetical protein
MFTQSETKRAHHWVARNDGSSDGDFSLQSQYIVEKLELEELGGVFLDL